MKVHVPLDCTMAAFGSSQRIIGFPSRTDARGMKDGWLRVEESKDNLQSLNYFLWFVLESETLHWPDPKLREAPCVPLCVFLKTPVG